MKGSLLELVERCAREMAEQQELPLPEALGAQTRLFGKEGMFDSIGLVSLVIMVEEAIEDEYGISVTLADERAMSRSRSPFLTIGSLADYAADVLREAA